jgi:hypothetical protein
VGIGIFVPRSSNQLIRTSLTIPRGPGLHDDWAFSVKEETNAYRVGPAIAWRVSPTFRMGASMLLLYESQVATVQFAGGTRDDVTGTSSQFGVTSLLSKSKQIGAAVGWGFQWDLAPLRLGFSIVSPAVQFNSSSLTTSIVAGAEPAGGTTAASFASGEEETSSMALRTMAPLRARFGIAHPIGGGYVSLDADVQGPLDNDEQSIHRGSVVNVRLGARLPVARALSVGGGLFTDRSADRDPQAFGDARIQFYGAAVGVEFGSTLDVREARRTRALTFSTTVALRYAHGSGQLGALAVEPLTPTSAPPTTHLTNIQVDEVTLYLGSGLSF